MRITSLQHYVMAALLAAGLVVAGCGGGGGGESEPTLPVAATPPPADPAPDPDPDPQPDPDPDPQPNPDPEPEPEPDPSPSTPSYKNLFVPVSDAAWNETAVRKVLHAFAYGGQTSDAQLRAWANMAPELAIAQMLTFDKHNLRLSTPAAADTDGLAQRDGSLRGLAAFWASDDPANPVPPEQRESYTLSNHTGNLPRVWERVAMSRGLNPFRAKIGLWETNYHMAVNLSDVARMSLLRYYEDIMNAHEDGLAYEQVMAVAASSAAIALQYGHRTNRFSAGVCDCNEDFAREYHQLFFGILGSANPDHHENVTIKNTAKAFTDMAVHADPVTGAADFVDFGTFFHPDEPLEILGQMIAGTNARERIDEMVKVSINHPESLANLPVRIISDLADDNLNARKIAAIRAAWAKMPEKNLLSFLRGYSISTTFHDSSRVKFSTSLDRHLMFGNVTSTSNNDMYLELYAPLHYADDMRVFFPTHSVFGSQKGTEAAASDLVLRNAVNLSTRHVWRLRSTSGERFGTSWERDWARLIPRTPTSRYRVDRVAEWLWKRYVADGLKNYGPLERAHLHALLGADRDLAFLVDEFDPDRVITGDDVLVDAAIVTLLNELGANRLALDSSVGEDREQANRRVGMAINFIMSTPFVFAQEGR